MKKTEEQKKYAARQRKMFAEWAASAKKNSARHHAEREAMRRQDSGRNDASGEYYDNKEEARLRWSGIPPNADPISVMVYLDKRVEAYDRANASRARKEREAKFGKLGVPGVDRILKVLPYARIVGGAVRDMLLGQPVADVDFASSDSPEVAMVKLRYARIKTVPTGLAHGTITAVIGGHGFEITTLRRDIETDGRHATVAFTDNWKEDAARRDFTINAMSMDQDGTVYDYFDGRADLAAGRLRFVGDAETRITEDYLRILRFFRFFARYGKGEPDAEAVVAITKYRDGIEKLSVERIWSELKRLLVAADPGISVALMESTGVLRLVVPEGADISALQGLIGRGAPAEPLLRVAALIDGNVESFAARLKLSTEELETLIATKKANRLTPAAGDADLRRALADEDAKILIARTWLAQNGESGWAELRDRIATTPRPVFPLQGRDIVALGVPPGPRIGRILEATRGWWLAGGCSADFDSCLKQAAVFE